MEPFVSVVVDFLQGFKPRYKLDVRELMDQGFQEAQRLEETPRKSMFIKMIKWCQYDYFQETLTREEKLAYTKVADSILEEEAAK